MLTFLATANRFNWDSYSSQFVTHLLNGSMGIVKKIVIALLIWIIGKKLMKLILRFVGKAFERSHIDVSISKFLLSLIKFILYAILIITIISALGIETTSLITIIGSLGLTVGLSLQGSLSNFAGGVLILLFKPFKVGDYIVSGGNEGTVSMIDLLYTKLVTVDNRIITIPNGTLANSCITNVACEPERRVDLSIDVDYTTDLKKAKAILEEVIRANKHVLGDHEVTVFVGELGAHGITLSTRCWVKKEFYWEVLWALREEFKEAMDKNNISIPFPQVDVHMK